MAIQLLRRTILSLSLNQRLERSVDNNSFNWEDKSLNSNWNNCKNNKLLYNFLIWLTFSSKCNKNSRVITQVLIKNLRTWMLTRVSSSDLK